MGISDDATWLDGLMVERQRYAWHEARRFVRLARTFKDPGLKNFYLKRAMWHRAHAKQLRATLRDA